MGRKSIKFITLLILIPFLGFGQVIDTGIFTVEYDQQRQQPLWVEYTVTCPNGTASRAAIQKCYIKLSPTLTQLYSTKD